MRIILRPGEELVVEFRDSARVLDISYREDVGIRVDDNASGKRAIEERNIFSEPNAIPGITLRKDMSLEDRVVKIIVDHICVEPEKVKPDADLIDDLGADSLDKVELRMAFEEEFEITIEDADAEQAQTVGDVIKYIKKRT